MRNIGIWDISSGKPERLQRGAIRLERNLEEWIRQEPSLLLHGMTIIGHQVSVSSGYMDLLGIDPSGNWAVIEIKRADVRRETVAQAIDYAASISEMTIDDIANIVDPYLQKTQTTLSEIIQSKGLIIDEPSVENIVIYVVGTGRDEGLARMLRFLAAGIRINIVTFDIFEGTVSQRQLVRELSEYAQDEELSDIDKKSRIAQQEISVKFLRDRAFEANIGKQFDILLELGQSYNLSARLYKHSIMFTSPLNRTRMLYTFWVYPEDDYLIAWVSSKTFAEFYPISEHKAQSIIGEDRKLLLDPEGAKEFAESVIELFAYIEESYN